MKTQNLQTEQHKTHLGIKTPLSLRNFSVFSDILKCSEDVRIEILLRE